MGDRPVGNWKSFQKGSRRCQPGAFSGGFRDAASGIALSAIRASSAPQNLFPFMAGSASRFLAESWESNNLYWARLADEKGYSPVMLNVLVPALTRRMVANIFASNIDDWPALTRAMQETGEEFKQGKISPSDRKHYGPAVGIRRRHALDRL